MADVAKKLLIKPGHTVLVMNAPGRAHELLGPLPSSAEITTDRKGTADAVVFFARSIQDIKRLLPIAGNAAAGDRPLWVCYPKGGSGVKTDLNRDIIRELADQTEWRTVTQVAIDAIWSALRLRESTRAGR
jgi:hypothetical protein